MDLILSFNVLIDLLSFTTALMLGVLFLFKQPKNNLYLGLFLLCLAIEILHPLLSGIAEKNAISNYFPLQTTLFTLIFLFFYVKKTIQLPIHKSNLSLFIPGFLINIIGFPTHDSILLHLLEYVFNLVLIFHVYSVLKMHQKRITNFYSEIEQKTLSWIKTILFVFLFFNLIWIS